MKISLMVNGQTHHIDVQPMRRLLDVLRDDLGLTGTKEGCGEGECGACAIHVDGLLLNACQIPAYQAHGRRVLTVEGLGTPEAPDPLQAAFVTEGGVQCGFCTPGLLMASRALLNSNPSPTVHEIRTGLAGNLCRCTGYGRVVQAVQTAACSPHRTTVSAAGCVPPPQPSAGDRVQVHMPTCLGDALDILAGGDCTLVAGGTDLMAALHGGRTLPDKVLDLSRLPELRSVDISASGAVLGATVNYTELQTAKNLAVGWPALVEAACMVGAPAVQNAGTIGGNLANASPGADLVPVLAALDGVVVLVSKDGERRIPITAFYRGYRDCDLRRNELIRSVELPRPPATLRQAFFKAGTRRAQSIARVNLAACARVDETGKLRDVHLVAGSVGPTIAVLRRTMAWLEGHPLEDADMADAAGGIASSEIRPIDDVRATTTYRRTVIGNLVTRFLKNLEN